MDAFHTMCIVSFDDSLMLYSIGFTFQFYASYIFGTWLYGYWHLK